MRKHETDQDLIDGVGSLAMVRSKYRSSIAFGRITKVTSQKVAIVPEDWRAGRLVYKRDVLYVNVTDADMERARAADEELTTTIDLFQKDYAAKVGEARLVFANRLESIAKNTT